RPDQCPPDGGDHLQREFLTLEVKARVGTVERANAASARRRTSSSRVPLPSALCAPAPNKLGTSEAVVPFAVFRGARQRIALRSQTLRTLVSRAPVDRPDFSPLRGRWMVSPERSGSGTAP